MNSAKLPDGIRLVFYAPGNGRQPPVLALGRAGTGLDLQTFTRQQLVNVFEQGAGPWNVAKGKI